MNNEIMYPTVLMKLNEENIQGLPPGGGFESKWVFFYIFIFTLIQGRKFVYKINCLNDISYSNLKEVKIQLPKIVLFCSNFKKKVFENEIRAVILGLMDFESSF